MFAAGLGEFEPDENYTFVTDVKDWKSGEGILLLEAGQETWMAMTESWEPVNKAAKDLQGLVDPDHILCSKGDIMHIKAFHMGMLEDWMKTHPQDEPVKEE